MSTRDVTTRETTFIYGLVDPRTGDLRWVGKSDDPQRRLRGHVSSRDSDTPRGAWLRDLWAHDLVPALVLFEKVAMEDWRAAECEWIDAKQAEGCPLLNVNRGGGGGDTRIHGKPEVRRKMSRSHKASALSLAARERGAAAVRGVPKTPEHRAKIGAAQVGKIVSPQARRALSAAKRGRPVPHLLDADTRAKAIQAMTATKRERAAVRAARVQSLRAAGMHPLTIAEKLGCTFQTVYVDLKRSID
jgi:hypothetical protein